MRAALRRPARPRAAPPRACSPATHPRPHPAPTRRARATRPTGRAAPPTRPSPESRPAAAAAPSRPHTRPPTEPSPPATDPPVLATDRAGPRTVPTDDLDRPPGPACEHDAAVARRSASRSAPSGHPPQPLRPLDTREPPGSDLSHPDVIFAAFSDVPRCRVSAAESDEILVRFGDLTLSSRRGPRIEPGPFLAVGPWRFSRRPPATPSRSRPRGGRSVQPVRKPGISPARPGHPRRRRRRVYCESLPCPCATGNGGGASRPPAPAPARHSATTGCVRPRGIVLIGFSATKYLPIRARPIRGKT